MEQLNNAKMIYSILDNKKAIDLKLFDTNNVSLLADYFIVATVLMLKRLLKKWSTR